MWGIALLANCSVVSDGKLYSFCLIKSLSEDWTWGALDCSRRTYLQLWPFYWRFDWGLSCKMEGWALWLLRDQSWSCKLGQPNRGRSPFSCVLSLFTRENLILHALVFLLLGKADSVLPFLQSLGDFVCKHLLNLLVVDLGHAKRYKLTNTNLLFVYFW